MHHTRHTDRSLPILVCTPRGPTSCTHRTSPTSRQVSSSRNPRYTRYTCIRCLPATTNPSLIHGRKSDANIFISHRNPSIYCVIFFHRKHFTSCLFQTPTVVHIYSHIYMHYITLLVCRRLPAGVALRGRRERSGSAPTRRQGCCLLCSSRGYDGVLWRPRWQTLSESELC